MDERYGVGGSDYYADALEVLRDELFDTKELPPTGMSTLDFFYNPNPAEGLSNMHASGQLPYPQIFLLYGLTLKIYSMVDYVNRRTQETIDGLDRFREMLLANALLEYQIGSKLYLQVPANAIVNGLAPQGIEKLSDTIFAIPELTEEDFEGICKEYTLPPFDKFEIRKPKGPIAGPVIKYKPGVHFFNMTVYIEGKPKPLYVPCQQFFRGKIAWEQVISFNEELLGRVFVRMGMAGLRWREMQ